METEIYRKLPVTIKNGREVYEASLAVCLNYAEVRNVSDPIGIVLSSDQSQGGGLLRKVMGFTRKKSEIRNCPGESVYPNSDDSTEFDSDVKARSGPYQALEPDPVQKNGFFLWKKKRRLSLKPSWETSIDMTGEVNDAVGIQDVDRSVTTFQAEPDEILLDTNSVTTIKEEERWKEKEIVSRDGKSRLKSQVFFASIDQRSKKAAGESACTALVAVMAHWLLSSPAHLFQPRPDFDDLIITGSLEWQKLCNNETYITTFPDRHFDLETVIKAKIRPLTVQAEKSFVGFFCPEKFDCLKEAMSFDQIWEEIESKEEDSVYIVSWNDHFFVLKMEEDACYVIDSLGERLFEGCNQAYILKFDGSSSMMLHENVENEGEDDVICRGKECCREFIKRFLAGVTVRELEEEQDRNDFSPHQRLQIELHYTNLVTSSC